MHDSSSQTSKQKPSILLVEGKKELGPMLKIMFHYEGLELEVVNIEDEILSLEKYKAISIIMLNALDLQTRFVCQLFRSHPITRTIPLVLIGTQAERKNAQDICSAEAYVLKPLELDKDEPIATLRSILPSLAVQLATYANDQPVPYDTLIKDHLSEREDEHKNE